jgi:hypothetical protein
MLAVVQKIAQCAVVLYLVIHGLPVVSAAELRGLASAVLAQFSRQPRRSAARIAPAPGSRALSLPAKSQPVGIYAACASPTSAMLMTEG